MKKFSSKTIKVKNSVKMTALSTRAIAANLILQVLDEGKSLSALVPEVQLSVKAQDLPLLQEICFGVCRVLPRLEQLSTVSWISRLKVKLALFIACCL